MSKRGFRIRMPSAYDAATRLIRLTDQLRELQPLGWATKADGDAVADATDEYNRLRRNDPARWRS